MLPLKIMQRRSRNHQMFQPTKRRIRPAIIFPSENLVRIPQIADVIGKIARITLTIQGSPK